MKNKLLYLIFFFTLLSNYSLAESVRIICNHSSGKGPTLEETSEGKIDLSTTTLNTSKSILDIDLNDGKVEIDVVSKKKDMLKGKRRKDKGTLLTHKNGLTVYGTETVNSIMLGQSIFFTFTIYNDGSGIMTKVTQYDSDSMVRVNSKMKNYSYLFPIKCSKPKPID